ncbi:MAG TPA: SRPBCC family protein [Candidatus Limnocylindria bacterium]|nr:SRPBCC family protein [Candidatus Limnocylindria bacterium]
MIRSETTVVINRPAAEIVSYVADIDRMTEWTDMSASRRLTDGPTGEGTQAYAEVALGPMKLGWTWEVTDFDPVHGYGYRTISKSAMGMDGRVTVTPQGADSSRVDYLVEVKTRGLLRLMEPLIRGEISRNESSEATRLKQRLEGSPTRDAAASAAAAQ